MLHHQMLQLEILQRFCQIFLPLCHEKWVQEPSVVSNLSPSIMLFFNPSEGPPLILSESGSLIPNPSYLPSLEESATPSSLLSTTPGVSPSDVPTINPSVFPSDLSSLMPSEMESGEPFSVHSTSPSIMLSFDPSRSTSLIPSESDSLMPIISPAWRNQQNQAFCCQ